jgi:hypothetical protein
MTSITDVLALIGGPGLDDSSKEARQRFRQFLCQPKWSPDDLRGWIDECMEMASRARSDYYFALQDLVVSIGTHLGFEVEFGSYMASDADIPFDGKWRSITGEEILVEVKSSPWPLGSTSQVCQYMELYSEYTGIEPDQVFGLYAIGGGDFTGLSDQIRGSDYRNRLKVASFHDLLRMFSLREILVQQLPTERTLQVLQHLLLPLENVNVTGLVDIIQGVAYAAMPTPEHSPSADPTILQRQWRRSELRDFLEECQPNQIAMLMALVTSPRPEITGDEMVQRMRAIWRYVPGLDESQPCTSKNIGGARSGFSKREQLLGKDSIIESFNGLYCIREECREWVAEWLRSRGILPAPVEVDLDERAAIGTHSASAAG